MKFYKGTLWFHDDKDHSHYYLKMGDPKNEHDWKDHLIIGERDIVETYNKSKEIRIIIPHFPKHYSQLDELLGASAYRTWCRAVKLHWETEVVKVFESPLVN